MATFSYLATDANGRKVKGMISADSVRAARDKLRSDSLRVVSISTAGSAKSSKSFSEFISRGKKRYAGKLTQFVRELATLLQAGIPLSEALASAVEQNTGGFRDTLTIVRDKVNAGLGLADAMAAEPTVFDEMTVGLIRVGEHAGNLDEVCEQIAEFRERSGELRDRVLSALLYPMIVLLVSLGVTVFLMTVVVPMLLVNLVELGRPLPWPTRVLKSLSNLLLNHGFLLVVASCLVFLGMGVWLNTVSGRRKVCQWLLKAPVIGNLSQKQVISRMALVLSSLLRSGVELVDALKIAERSATNVLLREALSEVRQDLEMGRAMRSSFDKHAIFPASVGQIFSLGQQSGQLDKMLERLGKDYDRQAATIATRLTSIVEPVLILSLGIVVGFILFATMLPILEAGNVLSET